MIIIIIIIIIQNILYNADSINKFKLQSDDSGKSDPSEFCQHLFEPLGIPLWPVQVINTRDLEAIPSAVTDPFPSDFDSTFVTVSRKERRDKRSKIVWNMPGCCTVSLPYSNGVLIPTIIRLSLQVQHLSSSWLPVFLVGTSSSYKTTNLTVVAEPKGKASNHG